jgi:cytochrome c-type biogenesis protein CcmE
MVSKRAKFVLGGSAIAAAIAYLIATGMNGTASYYLTVAEAVGAEALGKTEAVRVKGKVREGSSQWDPRSLRLSFALADGQQQISVSYHGLVPDLFAEGREIIVEGRLSPEGLVAESLLASCPSKYEPQDAPAAHLAP